MRFSAIILSGGNGERFSGDKKKQDIFLSGKPVWKWVSDTCEDHFDDIVIVGMDVPGGKTRQESCKIGINNVSGDYVVIFDAVRPLVTPFQIECIKGAVLEHPSVTFGIEPVDTIYDDGDYKRSGLIALQVPQAFDLNSLRMAHKHTNMENATDDTVIFKEYWDVKPKILEGGRNLYKLTYKEDLPILESLCKTI